MSNNEIIKIVEGIFDALIGIIFIIFKLFIVFIVCVSLSGINSSLREIKESISINHRGDK